MTFRSALDRAWRILLTRSAGPYILEKLRTIFGLWHDSLWVEEQQFTAIQKIVLVASNLDMQAMLKLSTLEIDEKDDKGRTPIS